MSLARGQQTGSNIKGKQEILTALFSLHGPVLHLGDVLLLGFAVPAWTSTDANL